MPQSSYAVRQHRQKCLLGVFKWGGGYLLARCAGITQAGTACKGIPLEGSGHCYAHHPDHVETRWRHGSSGGKRGGRRRPVAELGAQRVKNDEIRERLLEGKLKPGVAAVAIESINTDILAVGAALKAREQEELAREVDELRIMVEMNKEQRRYGS